MGTNEQVRGNSRSEPLPGVRKHGKTPPALILSFERIVLVICAPEEKKKKKGYSEI